MTSKFFNFNGKGKDAPSLSLARDRAIGKESQLALIRAQRQAREADAGRVKAAKKIQNFFRNQIKGRFLGNRGRLLAALSEAEESIAVALAAVAAASPDRTTLAEEAVGLSFIEEEEQKKKASSAAILALLRTLLCTILCARRATGGTALTSLSSSSVGAAVSAPTPHGTETTNDISFATATTTDTVTNSLSTLGIFGSPQQAAKLAVVRAQIELARRRVAEVESVLAASSFSATHSDDTTSTAGEGDVGAGGERGGEADDGVSPSPLLRTLNFLSCSPTALFVMRIVRFDVFRRIALVLVQATKMTMLPQTFSSAAHEQRSSGSGDGHNSSDYVHVHSGGFGLHFLSPTLFNLAFEVLYSFALLGPITETLTSFTEGGLGGERGGRRVGATAKLTPSHHHHHFDDDNPNVRGKEEERREDIEKEKDAVLLQLMHMLHFSSSCVTRRGGVVFLQMDLVAALITAGNGLVLDLSSVGKATSNANAGKKAKECAPNGKGRTNGDLSASISTGTSCSLWIFGRQKPFAFTINGKNPSSVATSGAVKKQLPITTDAPKKKKGKRKGNYSSKASLNGSGSDKGGSSRRLVLLTSEQKRQIFSHGRRVLATVVLTLAQTMATPTSTCRQNTTSSLCSVPHASFRGTDSHGHAKNSTGKALLAAALIATPLVMVPLREEEVAGRHHSSDDGERAFSAAFYNLLSACADRSSHQIIAAVRSLLFTPFTFSPTPKSTTAAASVTVVGGAPSPSTLDTFSPSSHSSSPSTLKTTSSSPISSSSSLSTDEQLVGILAMGPAARGLAGSQGPNSPLMVLCVSKEVAHTAAVRLMRLYSSALRKENGEEEEKKVETEKDNDNTNNNKLSSDARTTSNTPYAACHYKKEYWVLLSDLLLSPSWVQTSPNRLQSESFGRSSGPRKRYLFAPVAAEEILAIGVKSTPQREMREEEGTSCSSSGVNGINNKGGLLSAHTVLNNEMLRLASSYFASSGSLAERKRDDGNRKAARVVFDVAFVGCGGALVNDDNEFDETEEDLQQREVSPVGSLYSDNNPFIKCLAWSLATEESAKQLRRKVSLLLASSAKVVELLSTVALENEKKNEVATMPREKGGSGSSSGARPNLGGGSAGAASSQPQSTLKRTEEVNMFSFQKEKVSSDLTGRRKGVMNLGDGTFATAATYSAAKHSVVGAVSAASLTKTAASAIVLPSDNDSKVSLTAGLTSLTQQQLASATLFTPLHGEWFSAEIEKTAADCAEVLLSGLPSLRALSSSTSAGASASPHRASTHHWDASVGGSTVNVLPGLDDSFLRRAMEASRAALGSTLYSIGVLQLASLLEFYASFGPAAFCLSSLTSSDSNNNTIISAEENNDADARVAMDAASSIFILPYSCYINGKSSADLRKKKERKRRGQSKFRRGGGGGKNNATAANNNKRRALPLLGALLNALEPQLTSTSSQLKRGTASPPPQRAAGYPHTSVARLAFAALLVAAGSTVGVVKPTAAAATVGAPPSEESTHHGRSALSDVLAFLGTSRLSAIVTNTSVAFSSSSPDSKDSAIGEKREGRACSETEIMFLKALLGNVPCVLSTMSAPTATTTTATTNTALPTPAAPQRSSGFGARSGGGFGARRPPAPVAAAAEQPPPLIDGTSPNSSRNTNILLSSPPQCLLPGGSRRYASTFPLLTLLFLTVFGHYVSSGDLLTDLQKEQSPLCVLEGLAADLSESKRRVSSPPAILPIPPFPHPLLVLIESLRDAAFRGLIVGVDTTPLTVLTSVALANANHKTSDSSNNNTNSPSSLFFTRRSSHPSTLSIPLAFTLFSTMSAAKGFATNRNGVGSVGGSFSFPLVLQGIPSFATYTFGREQDSTCSTSMSTLVASGGVLGSLYTVDGSTRFVELLVVRWERRRTATVVTSSLQSNDHSFASNNDHRVVTAANSSSHYGKPPSLPKKPSSSSSVYARLKSWWAMGDDVMRLYNFPRVVALAEWESIVSMRSAAAASTTANNTTDGNTNNNMTAADTTTTATSGNATVAIATGSATTMVETDTAANSGVVGVATPAGDGDGPAAADEDNASSFSSSSSSLLDSISSSSSFSSEPATDADEEGFSSSSRLSFSSDDDDHGNRHHHFAHHGLVRSGAGRPLHHLHHTTATTATNASSWRSRVLSERARRNEVANRFSILNTADWSPNERIMAILLHFPFLVPFPVRVSLFSSLLFEHRSLGLGGGGPSATARRQQQQQQQQRWQGGTTSSSSSSPVVYLPQTRRFEGIFVRRSHVFEDAFELLKGVRGSALQHRFTVRFVLEDDDEDTHHSNRHGEGNEAAGTTRGGGLGEVIDVVAQHRRPAESITQLLDRSRFMGGGVGQWGGAVGPFGFIDDDDDDENEDQFRGDDFGVDENDDNGEGDEDWDGADDEDGERDALRRHAHAQGLRAQIERSNQRLRALLMGHGDGDDDLLGGFDEEGDERNRQHQRHPSHNRNNVGGHHRRPPQRGGRAPTPPQRRRVRFEAGAGDGVYRDFMFKVCQQGFGPSVGLFTEANGQALSASSTIATAAAESNALLAGSVYPNPDAAAVLGLSTTETLERFRILGVLVGRALYDGILLETNFAPFFRNLLIGRQNTVTDVASYDAGLYKSFGEMRRYAAENPCSFEEDMGLFFTVTVERRVRRRVGVVSPTTSDYPTQQQGNHHRSHYSNHHHHSHNPAGAATHNNTNNNDNDTNGTYNDDDDTVLEIVRAEVPLIPGGERIPVTAANVDAYITLVADYYLNRTIQRYSEAFRNGLFESIEESWLKMFDAKELQILFRGGDEEDVGLDIADWRANTVYSVQPDLLRAIEAPSSSAGGRDVEDAVVETLQQTANTGPLPPFILKVLNNFWYIVEHELTPYQQRGLLQFATSMRRAPLLGFSHMTPRFNLTLISGSVDRLPTAATCFCMMKMPCYPTRALMRERLLLAIEGATTFEMA